MAYNTKYTDSTQDITNDIQLSTYTLSEIQIFCVSVSKEWKKHSTNGIIFKDILIIILNLHKITNINAKDSRKCTKLNYRPTYTSAIHRNTYIKYNDIYHKCIINTH